MGLHRMLERESSQTVTVDSHLNKKITTIGCHCGLHYIRGGISADTGKQLYDLNVKTACI